VAQRVRRVIKDLDFIPSRIAATLKYGRGKTCGVIVPGLANPFHPESLAEFGKILAESHREMLLTAAVLWSAGRHSNVSTLGGILPSVRIDSDCLIEADSHIEY
jgi:hypothetical protein